MIFDPLYSTISSQFSNKEFVITRSSQYNQTVFYLYQLSQPQAILCCQLPSVATKGEQLQIKHSGSILITEKPVKVSSRSLAQHVQTTQSFVTYLLYTHGIQQLSVVVLDKH